MVKKSDGDQPTQPARTDYEVGYKKPSKAHQFTKGYCPHRNYSGRPKKVRVTIAEEIDKAFASVVRVKLKPGADSERISVFELIVRRLYEKAMKGDDCALKTLEKYQIYAASKPIVKIVDNPPSNEVLASRYAALLAEDELDPEDIGKPREIKIFDVIFPPGTPPEVVAEEYYRQFDEGNKLDEKKIRRRKLF